ncbi:MULTISPECIES: ribonuclease D [unclassified Pseudoalteromonas]|uniref:ribonuclease D n=1 Tax=unclassified Pseudoalteromonas TaxID=194690 RepID=UPI000CF61221|nr:MULTISPECIES: ribonuclease D [unclassified Pseudoalteromonas]
MEYQLITEQGALDTFVGAISKAKVLAVDTEFMRRRTLYPEIALLQVFDGQHLALIDPLAELDLSALWALLQKPEVLKVLHSPSEDIEVFQNFAGFVPTPLFDTQFALQLLGSGNCMGFAAMVNARLGIEIDKSESRTNWLQRPLRESQLTYAAADVAHLLPCFEQIVEEINAKGWFDIVIAESQLISQKRAFSTPDDLLYRDVKGAWQLSPRDLAALRELAMWRREKAQRKNLALNFIVKEANMVEIAKRRPSSLNSMRNIPGVDAMEVNRSGREMLACIERAKELSDEQLPPRVMRLMDYRGYKQAAKEIKQKITAVSKATQIPADVFASKKQINQLISWNWKLTDDERQILMAPDILQPWRSEYLSEALEKWIPGAQK